MNEMNVSIEKENEEAHIKFVKKWKSFLISIRREEDAHLLGKKLMIDMNEVVAIHYYQENSTMIILRNGLGFSIALDVDELGKILLEATAPEKVVS